MPTEPRPYLQHGDRHGGLVRVGSQVGSDPPIGGARVSFGQVYNDAGTIDPGSGDWTASEVGFVVTVTFDPPFSSPPTILLTANKNNVGGTPGYFVEQDAVAEDHFDVAVYREDGTTVDDGGFNFLAIGF